MSIANQVDLMMVTLVNTARAGVGLPPVRLLSTLDICCAWMLDLTSPAREGMITFAGASQWGHNDDPTEHSCRPGMRSGGGMATRATIEPLRAGLMYETSVSVRRVGYCVSPTLRRHLAQKLGGVTPRPREMRFCPQALACLQMSDAQDGFVFRPDPPRENASRAIVQAVMKRATTAQLPQMMRT